eukprot:m51a1_g7430 hypothetical protein (536) ;mRNA; r:40981-42649
MASAPPAPREYDLPAQSGAYHWSEHAFALPPTSFVLRFQARASNSVCVALSPRPRTEQPMVELVVGGRANTSSVLRLRSGGPAVSRHDAEGLCCPTEWRGFWLRFAGREVAAGTEGCREPFVRHVIPRRFDVAVGCFSTWDAPAQYRVVDVAEALPVPAPVVASNEPAMGLCGLAGDMRALFADAAASGDVAIRAQGEGGQPGASAATVCAHWAILCARCPYFRAMCSWESRRLQGAQGRAAPESVALDAPCDVVRAVLEWVYCADAGPCTNRGFERALHCARLADMLCLAALADACARAAISWLSEVGSSADVAELAADESCIPLAKAAAECLALLVPEKIVPPVAGWRVLSIEGEGHVAVDVPHFACEDEYTLEAWIRPTEHGTFGIIGWGEWGTRQHVNALRLGESNQLVNSWWGDDLVAPVQSLSGAWHHVAATYTRKTGWRRLYVDGSLVGENQSFRGRGQVPNEDFCVGRTNVREYFQGYLAEVRVWKRALTAEEIGEYMRTQVSQADIVLALRGPADNCATVGNASWN